MSSAMFWKQCLLIYVSIISSLAVDITGIDQDGTIIATIGKPLYVQIREGVTNQIIQVNDIDTNVISLMCEVHINHLNVTLSLTAIPSESTAITGRDLGVITLLDSQPTLAEWFLVTNNYTGFALIYVKGYTAEDPLPGGCNQEFNLEYYPNIKLLYLNHLTNVDFQWSNDGFSRFMPAPSCDVQTDLHYSVYIYFMDEVKSEQLSPLETVNAMLTVDGILENAVHVKSIQNNNNEKSDLTMVSYPCVSAVVNIVVSRTHRGMTTSSAYVPTVVNPDLMNCEENKKNIAAITISCVTIILGCFLSFFGHRYFKTELFIFGAIAGLLIAHITVSALWTHTLTVLLTIDFLSAMVGGILWLIIWTSFGIPVVSVLMVSLVAGYLISSILFFTPFGNLKYWHNDFNYGMTFASGAMLLSVVFLAYTKLLNIICCALVGSYAIVFSIDILTYGIIRYIFLNSFHRMIYADFSTAIAVTPFQKNDIILAAVWAGIFLCGVIFQLYCESGRAPFPPAGSIFSCQNCFQRRSDVEVEEEQEHLIPNNPHHHPGYHYGTVSWDGPPARPPPAPQPNFPNPYLYNKHQV
ncbi:transmembrane 7 superfamily member 3-like [Argonauta hians]